MKFLWLRRYQLSKRFVLGALNFFEGGWGPLLHSSRSAGRYNWGGLDELDEVGGCSGGGRISVLSVSHALLCHSFRFLILKLSILKLHSLSLHLLLLHLLTLTVDYLSLLLLFNYLLVTIIELKLQLTDALLKQKLSLTLFRSVRLLGLQGC